MRTDYSCYEGMEISGGVDTVLSRGKMIIAGDEYLGNKGDGRYLKRELNQYLV
jgi:dihydropyrimidinase